MKQAIEAPRTNHFMVDPEDLTIVETPGAPFYDERVKLPLSDEMLASIAEYGVLEPILAVKRGDDLVVIAGRQRVRHARKLNEGRKKADRVLVPTITKRAEDARLEAMSIVENEHRVQDDPITRALKMARFMDRCGDADAVALAFGVSPSVVKQSGKLLDLHPAVQTMVRTGKLPAAAALQFHGMPEAEQLAKAEEVVASGAPAVEAARRARKGKASSEEGEEASASPAPGRALLRRIADAVEEKRVDVPAEDFVLLKWILGRASEKTARKHIGWLDEALTAAREDRRKSAAGESAK